MNAAIRCSRCSAALRFRVFGSAVESTPALCLDDMGGELAAYNALQGNNGGHS